MQCSQCLYWLGAPKNGATHAPCAAVPHDRHGYGSYETTDMVLLEAEKDEWAHKELTAARHLRQTGATVRDASGYAARLWTRGDFGCLLFRSEEELSQRGR